jgi:Ca2+-binding RTX toxin-like protein
VVLENAGEGTDYVFATTNHTLQAGSHVEVLAAYVASDTAPLELTGNAFANTIAGNAGSNSLYGGGGTDTFMGFGGNDYYVVDSADDTVLENAGEGTDYVFATADYTLQAGSHVEVLAAYAASGTGALRLSGNELSNTIAGNAGFNLLNGGGGADQLTGGGAGDQFFFDTAPGGGNVDNITDFVSGVDSILLENAVFTGLPAGALAPGAFRTGASAQDADDRLIYNMGSGFLIFDADGSGPGGAVLFATVAPMTSISASDFTVI